MEKVYNSNLIDAFTHKLFESKRKQTKDFYQWGKYNVETYGANLK